MQKYDFDLIDVSELVQKLGIKYDAKSKNYHCINSKAHEKNDKNGSMGIDEKSGAFHCFACGISGKRLELVEQALNLSSQDALKWLKENFPQAPTAEKYRVRLINSIKKGSGRFIHSECQDARRANESDIEKCRTLMNKVFTIDGFERAGCYITDANYGIVMPHKLVCNYTQNPIGNIIVEGSTDFLSLCSNPIVDCYNIQAHTTKTDSKFSINFDNLPTYIFLDSDNTETNFFNYIKNKDEELKNQLIYFIKLSDKFNVKDISELIAGGVSNIETILDEAVLYDINAYLMKENSQICFWDRKGSINILELWRTLVNEGFSRISLDRDKPNEHIQMRIKQNIATDFSDNDQIISYVYNDLIDSLPIETNANVSIETIRHNIVKNEPLFSNKKFNLLPKKYQKFNRDTKDTAYFYFQNKVVKITKTNIELMEYKDLPYPVFANQIKNANIELIEGDEFYDLPFYVFLQNICKPNRDADVDIERFDALKSVIGYLLHKFNNPTNMKAVIFSESNTSDVPKGRTGKGLIMDAVKEMVNLTNIGAKLYDITDTFAFASVGISDNVVVLNDVQKGFKFENLFNIITDGMQIRKLHSNPIYLPPSISPKIALTTNYTVQSEDTSSYRGRMYEMEIHCYYDAIYTPFEELGEWFFYWEDEKSWTLFYNMMFKFCQYFLNNGLMEYSSTTMKTKKANNVGGSELIEFLDNEINNFVEGCCMVSEKIFNCKQLYSRFLEFAVASDAKSFTSNRFGRSLTAYCDAKNIELKKDVKQGENGKSERVYRFIRKNEEKE